MSDIDKFLKSTTISNRDYDEVRKAYYTALGRERESMYRQNNPSIISL